MAEVVAILSTCWKLINAIQDVVEQTREDGRTLQYLERQATSFLEMVNQGLVGCDASPYAGTIMTFENQYGSGPDVETESISAGVPHETNHSRPRKELRFFVDSYLIHTATQNTRINLEAMASPRPIPTANDPPLIPDDIQWEIMSQRNDATTTVGPTTRILNWNRGVVNASTDETELRCVNTEEPHRTPSMDVTQPAMDPAKYPSSPPNSCEQCTEVWADAFVAFVRYGILCPVYSTFLCLDCAGYVCTGFRPTESPACCGNCCLKYFPVCTSVNCLAVIYPCAGSDAVQEARQFRGTLT